jgi:hypothetical protein
VVPLIAEIVDGNATLLACYVETPFINLISRTATVKAPGERGSITDARKSLHLLMLQLRYD